MRLIDSWKSRSSSGVASSPDERGGRAGSAWSAESRRSWLRFGLAAVVLVGGVASLVVVSISYFRTAPRGNPDPGGQIIRSIATVDVALPSDAKVRLAQQVEPSWDSCDGQPGTFGWDDVQVNYQFTTQLSLGDLLATADAKMRAAGWTTTGDGAWKRSVNGGTATATLSRDGGPSSKRWELNADAPPIGVRSSGC